MAAARITADATGRLKVPDEPVVVVVEGDGVGPELWRATRPALDEAVARAYGGRRKLHFLAALAGERAERELNDSAPDATVNAVRLHRIALCGPLAEGGEDKPSLVRELREVLDLYVGAFTLRSPGGRSPTGRALDLLLLREEREDAGARVELAPGSPGSFRMLDFLRDEAPAELERMRFGTAAQVDARARDRGELPSGFVQAGFAVRHASRVGAGRFVQAALRIARARADKRLTLLHDSRVGSERALLEWARETAAAEGAAMAPAGADAPTLREARDGAAAAGAVFFDAMEVASAGARLLRDSTRASVLAASHGTASLVHPSLAAATGGPATGSAAMLNPETGHAVFRAVHGPVPRLAGRNEANPAGLMRAGEQMLRHIAWHEAAELLRLAVEGAFAAGTVTADMEPFARACGLEPRPVPCRAFSDEVLARLRA